MKERLEKAISRLHILSAWASFGKRNPHASDHQRNETHVFADGFKKTEIHPIVNILRFLLIVTATMYVAVFILLALFKRIPFPYELEWMEGGIVTHVQRIRDGLGLYCEPTSEFVPFLYTPLYFYVGTLFSGFIGIGFLPLRLISFFSTIGCAVVIFAMIKKSVKGYAHAYLGACFFIAAFHVTGAWFDIARVDSLFLFFLLAALWMYQYENTFLKFVAAPMLLFLSFLTKQTALFVGVFLSCNAVFFHRGRLRAFFPLIFFFLVIGSTVLFNTLSDGWYGYYVIEVPLHHAFIPLMIIWFWIADIMKYGGIACIFCVFYMLALAGTVKSRVVVQDITILVSMLVASWFSRLHTGGYSNVLMPAYAAIAVYFGKGLDVAIRRSKHNVTLLTIILLAVFQQFVMLVYNPYKQIPGPDSLREGNHVLQTISRFDGDVFIPGHPWYGAMAGKKTYAHIMAIDDVQRAAFSEDVTMRLEQDIRGQISAGIFSAIILDTDTECQEFTQALSKSYLLVEQELTTSVFNPVTGGALRPRFLYVNRSALSSVD